MPSGYANNRESAHPFLSVSLVAKLETEVHAQSSEMQQAIQGLATQVAELRLLEAAARA
jgi:hypothetical protein